LDAYVLVESPRRFATLHTETGAPRAVGLKTEMFHASSHALINQAADAPQWAVQSWDGDMLQVVPRRGVPRLHGNTLLQFSGDTTVYGDVITSGERWATDLLQNSTVYHSTADSSGTNWLAVGTIDGRVLITDGPGGREWIYPGPTVGAGHPSPVYGVHVAFPDQNNDESDESSLLPDVFVVHGMSPQMVSRIELTGTGTGTGSSTRATESVTIGEIPEAYAGRAPQNVTVMSSGHLVVGLHGGLFVADLAADEVVTVSIPELTSLSGIGRLPNGVVIGAGTGQGRALIMVGESSLTSRAYWELADRSLRAQVAGPAPSGTRVIVQTNDRVIGLEITL
ncbi:MAG TPA: hypothetical protein VJ932_10585, partial [Alkalispirochaeta sp.]|nr:hypothetical protein [Alkalispirochaeta sp.]